MKPVIKNARKWLFVSLVALAPFSFTPSIGIASHGFVSLRVGLYQTLAGLFIILCLPLVWKNFSKLIADRWFFVSLVVMIAVVVSSPFRSIDITRSLFMSASILVLLGLVVSTWVFAQTELDKKLLSASVKAVLGVAVIVCTFAIVQFVVATYSTSGLGVALCANCSAKVFGFPRVSGFAAEPQFLGNSLILPLIASFVLFIKSGKAILLAVFGLVLFVIMLSLSRGALAAAGVALTASVILLARAKAMHSRRLLVTIFISVFVFMASVAAMVGSATVRYYKTTPGISGATFATVVEQLSVGTIDLPQNNPNKPITRSTAVKATNNNFRSPGVITASSSDRESAASTALGWWHKDITTIVLGLGAGNLGSFAHHQNPSSYSLGFTVYIQYVLMLVELGIFGIASFIILFWLAIYRSTKTVSRKIPIYGIILASLLIAYATQYIFFGTYINTVYVWLFMGLGLASIKTKALFIRGAKHR